ncbi:MAG: ABC transporter permease [Lentisphaeria bacterium]|nr:ABC transporter permease [Lentisphaeria bacterium]
MLRFEPLYDRPATGRIEKLGRGFFETVHASGKALNIMFESFRSLTACFKRRRDIGRQMFIIGIKSFAVAEIVALFTGMILALQAGLELQKYGQEVNVGILVSQTMCREMGPFMTALILAASVGSAMAAELGTMTVSEEIDALQIMNINPVRYLVMPRMIAMLIMTPVLTIFTDIIGTMGGALVAYSQLNVGWEAYYQNVLTLLKVKEIYVGLFKAAVFGVIITTVSCYQGLACRNGAMGVGIATRKSVVTSFLLILITGYFMTSLFYR